MNTRDGMLNIITALFLLVSLPAIAQQQTQTAQTSPPRLSFEVASIRPSPPLDMAKLAAEIRAGNMPRFGAQVDGSLAEYRYMPLKSLIANAYGVKPYEVAGPQWLSTERFDIEARLPSGASKDDAPQMLQALLAERFGMVAHRDSEEQKVLALVVANGGPKLQPAPAAPPPLDENAPLKPGEMQIETANGPARVTRNHDGSVTINMGAKGVITQKLDAQAGVFHIDSSTVTMGGFADMLTNIFQMGGTGGRQVVDMTGLTGHYQVDVDISLAGIMQMARAQGFVPPQPPASNTSGNQTPGQAASEPGAGADTVLTSVEKLGLKLESRKAMVQRIVVDKIDKTPTTN